MNYDGNVVLHGIGCRVGILNKRKSTLRLLPFKLCLTVVGLSVSPPSAIEPGIRRLQQMLRTMEKAMSRIYDLQEFCAEQ